MGLGLGWSIDEYEAVGVPYKARGRRADEFLRCLDAIWSNEVVEFHGEFYNVPRCKVEPRPIQKPRPPLTIGGYGSTVVKRAVTLGDGFNGGNVPMASVAPLVREVREAAAAIGKDPDKLHIVSRGTYQRPRQRPRARTAGRCGARSTRSARTSPATPRRASRSCSSRATSCPAGRASTRRSR